MWDVAVKYAADWNSVKFSAAAGYTQVTDEGCSPGVRRKQNLHQPRVAGWRWHAPPELPQGCPISSRSARPSCTFRQACSFMACIRTSRTTGPSGRRSTSTKTAAKLHDSTANETDVWYVKAGIKRAWMPAGATVLFGEWGQYNDMFPGLCVCRRQRDTSGNDCALPATARSHKTSTCRSASMRGTELSRTVMPFGQRTRDRFGSRALGHRRRAGDRLCRDACLRPLAASRPRPGCDRSRLTVVRKNGGFASLNKTSARAEHQLRRSRSLPNWWRDLLLNEQPPSKSKPPLSGGFFLLRSVSLAPLSIVSASLKNCGIRGS